MSKIRIFIFSTLLVMSGVFVWQPASARDSIIDFEKETERVVEDFQSVENIRFESSREWQRVVLEETDMFETLEGAVIADVSFSSTPIIMYLNQEAASLVFYYGYGRFQNTTTLEVQGYLDHVQVFNQTFEPHRNTYGYYEGIAVVDTPVDMIVVRSLDVRALLAIDHIREFEVRLNTGLDTSATLLVAKEAKTTHSLCLSDRIIDGYRILRDAKASPTTVELCQP